MKVKALASTISGNPMPRGVGAPRLNLIKRLVPEERLRATWASMSVADIAKEHEVTPTDIDNLALYYELPKKSRAFSQRPIEVDLLAERLWELLEPRVVKLVEQTIREML